MHIRRRLVLLHRPTREAARLRRLVARAKAGCDVVQDSADLRGVCRGFARGHQCAATQALAERRAVAELTAVRRLASRMRHCRMRHCLKPAGVAVNGGGRRCCCCCPPPLLLDPPPLLVEHPLLLLLLLPQVLLLLLQLLQLLLLLLLLLKLRRLPLMPVQLWRC